MGEGFGLLCSSNRMWLCCKALTANRTEERQFTGWDEYSFYVKPQPAGKAEDRRGLHILSLFVAQPRMARKCLHLFVSPIWEGEETAVSLRTASPFYKTCLWKKDWNSGLVRRP